MTFMGQAEFNRNIGGESERAAFREFKRKLGGVSIVVFSAPCTA